VVLGDVDGDGKLDLVAGNVDQPNRLYLNDGIGDPWDTVTPTDITADAHATETLALADADDDGDLDLIAGNDSGTHMLYLNDGTSDPFGRVWTASMLRRGEGRQWGLEALVLGTNFRGSLDPDAFQTRLPKSFIHRMVPGEPVHAFVEDWKAAARDTRGSEVWGPRAWFTAAAGALTARGYDIARPDVWPRRGWLVWRSPHLSGA